MRPVPRRWSVAPAVRANDSRACSIELGRQRSDALAAERQVDDGVRPPREVQGSRERLVHRHRCVAEPPDAGPVAERLGEGRAQHERDVLDRVVLVHVEVAGRLDLEVEQGVMGERSEQVVVEADARADGRFAPAVEVEGDRDVGLSGRPALGRCAPAHGAASKRISTARRCASRPSARARTPTVSRKLARPSRLTRWTWTQVPNASTLSAP